MDRSRSSGDATAGGLRAVRNLVIAQDVEAPIAEVRAASVHPGLMPKSMQLQAVFGVTRPLDRAGTRFTQVVFGRWRVDHEEAAIACGATSRSHLSLLDASPSPIPPAHRSSG